MKARFLATCLESLPGQFYESGREGEILAEVSGERLREIVERLREAPREEVPIFRLEAPLPAPEGLSEYPRRYRYRIDLSSFPEPLSG